jgi:hypothetical protein
MNSLQWLADAEIGRLEKLFEMPSPAESRIAAVIQELRAASEKARKAGNPADGR